MKRYYFPPAANAASGTAAVVAAGLVFLLFILLAGRAQASFLPSAVNGSIGIGTTAPAAKLDIGGGSLGRANAATGLLVKGEIEVDNRIYVDNQLYVGAGTVSWAGMNGTAGEALFANDVEIDGALYVDGFLYGNGSRLTGISAISGLTSNNVSKANAAGTGLIDSSLYDVSGNVGLGTTVPLAKLSIIGAGTTTGVAFETRDSAKAAKVTMLDNGSMGIGSTAPRAKLEVSGSVTISGDVTMSSALSVKGAASINTLVLAPASAGATTVGTGGIAAVTGSFMRIVSSGGAVSVTNIPQITVTSIPDGQELILYGTHDTNTVQFHDGDGLSLDSAVSFTIKNHYCLRLIFNSTDSLWREVSRTLH